MSAKGGITKGKSHKEGGIPMQVKSTGQQVELEGGEGVINKSAMADTEKFDFEGEKLTKCEIASRINKDKNYGVSINCEDIIGKVYKYADGGKVDTATIEEAIRNALQKKGGSVKEKFKERLRKQADKQGKTYSDEQIESMYERYRINEKKYNLPYAKGGKITIEGNPYGDGADGELGDFFIYRDGVEVVSFNRDEMEEDDDVEDLAKEMFYLWKNDEEELGKRLDRISYAKGGRLTARTRFTDYDLDRLSYDFVVFDDRVETEDGKVVGTINSKGHLIPKGDKTLKNPLVKWLQQNSYVSNEEYQKLAKGGSVSDSDYKTAYKLGVESYKSDTIKAPAQDKKLLAFIFSNPNRNKVGNKETSELMDIWTKARYDENEKVMRKKFPEMYAKGGEVDSTRWIKTAVENIDEGAFTEEADKRNMSVEELMDKALNYPTKDDFIVDGKPQSKKSKEAFKKYKNTDKGEKEIKLRKQAQMVKNMGNYEQGGDIIAKGGRILVGRFDEKQLKNKEDKKAIEKAQKESGLTYIDSKIIKKGGKMFMEVYLIPNEEYYKSSKFAKGGKIYQVKDMDKFDEWYDWVAVEDGEWKDDEVRYEKDGVYIRDDIYETSDSLDRDNLYAKGGSVSNKDMTFDEWEKTRKRDYLKKGGVVMTDLIYPSNSLGIARSEMPQIRKHNYPEFLTELEIDGIDYKYIDVDAKTLKPTQSYIDLERVRLIEEAPTYKDKPIVVSNDGYVVDGHHRWYFKKKIKDDIPAIVIDLPVRELLSRSRDFNKVEFEKYDKGGITRANYPSLFLDTDRDGTPNVDDVSPFDATMSKQIEEVSLSKEMGTIIDYRNKYDDIRKKFVSKLATISDSCGNTACGILSRTKTPYSIINKLRRRSLTGVKRLGNLEGKAKKKLKNKDLNALDLYKGLTDIVGTMVVANDKSTLDKLKNRILKGDMGEVLEFEDFYAEPNNGYRAYHFIIGVKDKDIDNPSETRIYPIEVQIKTKRAKKLSEVSHTAYKEGRLNGKKYNELFNIIVKADDGDKKAQTRIDKLFKNKSVLKKAITSTKKMAYGGEVSFENYEQLPQNIQDLYFKYGEELEQGDENSYDILRRMEEDFNNKGYTFDWDLDAVPYNLQKMEMGGLTRQTNFIDGLKKKYAKGGSIDVSEVKGILGANQGGLTTDGMLEEVSKWYDKTPKLNSQDGKGKNAVVYLHYFNPSSDWYITELDKKDKIAFGYVVLNGDVQMSEFGYISLDELNDMSGVRNKMLMPELDYYWSPKTLNQAFQNRYPSLVSGEVEIYEEPTNEVNVDVVETSNILEHSFKNDFEKNLAIRELIDQKGSDTNNYSVEEKEFISTYSGMGGLEKFGATGKGLLYEYYTPKDLIEKMWGLVYKHRKDIEIKRVLEPSCGSGNFISLAPDNVELTGFDIDKYAISICNILFPQDRFDFQHKSFETIFFGQNNKSIRGNTKHLEEFDLVIGNPPYGTYSGRYAGMGEKKYTHATDFIDYFILRGLDVLKPNGLLVFVIGAMTSIGGKPFLDKKPNKIRQMIMEKADLVDAYRLGIGIFPTTQVDSDIIVLRKK